MWEILSWLFFIIFIAGLLVVGALLLRGYTSGGTGTSITGALFGPKPDRRLDVVDQANVDGRRRLVLIRRDNVEHLIMTGGPVDVVIETGIESQKSAATKASESRRSGEVVEPSLGTFKRPARPLGKVAGDS